MENNSSVTEKWGGALAAGFQQVPDVLLRGQMKLGLTPLDLPSC